MFMKSKLIILIMFGTINLSVLTAYGQVVTDLPSIKGRNVLLVYGGWDGHQPNVFAERVAAWLRTEGVGKLTISDSLGVYTNAKLMAETDLIIQYWTMGKITKEQETGLLTAVKNGTGLAGCHGGLGDSFRENTEYQYMVGGQWVAHPGGKIDYQVDIINVTDPITKGITDFEIKNTEQYYMHIDPNSEVLATTTFGGQHDSWIEGAVMPVSWKKYYDKGRVFYLSIGHDPNDFNTPSAWKLLTRGIQWASGSKYLPKEKLMKPVYTSRRTVKRK